MRKTFSQILIVFLFVHLLIAAGSPGQCAGLPADIYAEANFYLKHNEVIKSGPYLFTRVSLNPERGLTRSAVESMARLHAKGNFVDHLFGRVRWGKDYNASEKLMMQSLFGQVSSVSGVLNGFVRVDSYVADGRQSFIYAVDFPKHKIRKTSRDEAIAEIQSVAGTPGTPLDDFTYFEMALRKPDVLNPKLAVKRLSETYGRNFIFCLLGMDLNQPVDFSEIPETAISRLQHLEKGQFAILLNERPYNSTLALLFASNLMRTGHDQVAQMALLSGCRLDKTGESYGQMMQMAKKLKIQPPGSYHFIGNESHLEALFGEQLNARLSLTPWSKAILDSLGDLPLKPVKIQLFIPTTEYSQMPPEEFSAVFDELQKLQTKGINPELMKATADLLATNGYPHMAFCFRHQALYMNPKDKALKDKLLEQSSGIAFARYSKLLNP